MLKGTVVENSLTDAKILDDLNILKSWSDGDWNLHQVELTKEGALKLSKYIAVGPWYMHFWSSNKDDTLVVFKSKIFNIKQTDKSTWEGAIAFGKSVGIPEEQLDFLIH